MHNKKILVVFGSTGAQGGSVINSILGSDALSTEYHIRAVCRDVTKPAAKSLKARGVEIVSADLSSEDDVRSVLTEACSIFLVTDYSGNSCNSELELKQGKTVANVAKEVGIQHLIFSSLLHVSKITRNEITNAHEFDSKAKIEEHIRALQLPATFILAGFYMSIFAPGGFITKSSQRQNTWTLSLPLPSDKPTLPLLHCEADYGKFVTAALLKKSELIGARVFAAQGYYSPRQIADAVSKDDNAQRICYVEEVTDESFIERVSSSGDVTSARQKERLDMHRFTRKYGYFNGADLSENTKWLDQRLVSWEEYVANNPAFHV
ncbi:NmrA-domain-containing protein [Pyrenochaeta sp. DS3sAY3a]|nr:NmrA-domain-containing protein [Pyrenochaeta sp. DS3sAY3a]